MKNRVKLLFIWFSLFGVVSIGACTKDVAKATNSNPVPWQLSADSVSGTFAISGSYDNYNSSNSSGYHYYDSYVDTIIIKKVLGDTVPRISAINSNNWISHDTTYYLIYHDSLSTTYCYYNPSGAYMPRDYVSFCNHGDSVYESCQNNPQGPPGSYSHSSYMGHRIKR